jgi:hypothetical protein
MLQSETGIYPRFRKGMLFRDMRYAAVLMTASS